MVWIYFVVIGLVVDIVGAYLLIRSLLKVNPVVKPFFSMLFWQIMQAAYDQYGISPDKNIDKIVRDEALKYKQSKENLKGQEEGKTEFAINERKFIIQQVRDSVVGFALLIIGFILQLIGNLIQYLT